MKHNIHLVSYALSTLECGTVWFPNGELKHPVASKLHHKSTVDYFNFFRETQQHLSNTTWTTIQWQFKVSTLDSTKIPLPWCHYFVNLGSGCCYDKKQVPHGYQYVTPVYFFWNHIYFDIRKRYKWVLPLSLCFSPHFALFSRSFPSINPPSTNYYLPLSAEWL